MNGERLVITGPVDQRFELPGGALIVADEQVGPASADRGEITVGALHVVIPGLFPGADTDLHVARVPAYILCGLPAPLGRLRVRRRGERRG